MVRDKEGDRDNTAKQLSVSEKLWALYRFLVARDLTATTFGAFDFRQQQQEKTSCESRKATIMMVASMFSSIRNEKKLEDAIVVARLFLINCTHLNDTEARRRGQSSKACLVS